MKREQAIAFIELGWPVFPLVPNTKKPLTKNGFKDAVTSAFRVNKWWRDHPDANIGIATGQVSNLAVLDVDVKNGNPARVWKLYGTLAAKGDNLPEWPHRLSHILETPE